MTVAERRNVSGAQWRECAVSRLSDRETIHRILDERRPYAAYALGQLDPRLFHLTEWWLSQGGDTEALVLHSSGGLGKAAFMAGENETHARGFFGRVIWSTGSFCTSTFPPSAERRGAKAS